MGSRFRKVHQTEDSFFNNILPSFPLYTNTVIYRPKVVAKRLIANKLHSETNGRSVDN